MSALDLIAAERAAQIAKGYTAEHDGTHDLGELVSAAHSYLLAANPLDVAVASAMAPLDVPTAADYWPWGVSAPATAVDDRQRVAALVKAAALIVAEIERLQRRSSEEGL